MSINFPECPASLKSIQHYMKTASEHDSRDIVVAYWCRLYALQVGLKLTSKKTPDETALLIAVMDWLEKTKKQNSENESITNEVAAQAHLENYALKLFMYGDKMDTEQIYNKNVVKAFYTAGMIYDVLTTFGELSEEALQNRKYAKWKAAYIHNCLKNGEIPVSADESVEPDANPNNLQPGPISPQSPETGFTGPATVSEESTSSLPDPSVVDQLPAVPSEPKPNIGGFQPYISPEPVYNPATMKLSPELLTKAQKYCKFAGSALNFEDIPTAIDNLNKALTLLQTGKDPA